MIKCNIKREGRVRVKATGTAQDMRVETAVLIKEVHRSILEQSPEAARGYRRHLMGLLLDPKSPVWKEDDHGKTAL